MPSRSFSIDGNWRGLISSPGMPWTSSVSRDSRPGKLARTARRQRSAGEPRSGEARADACEVAVPGRDDDCLAEGEVADAHHAALDDDGGAARGLLGQPVRAEHDGRGALALGLEVALAV